MTTASVRNAAVGRASSHSIGKGLPSASFAGESQQVRKPIPEVVRRAFLFFIASIPFEAIPLPPLAGFISPAKVSGVLFFACCLWYPRTCFPRPAPAVLWFFGHLELLVVLGLFIPRELLGQLAFRTSTMLQLTIFFWVGSSLLQDTRLTRQTLFTFGASAAALALGSLLGVPVLSAAVRAGQKMQGTRASALAYNPNYLAAVMAVAALMLIGLLLDNTRRTRGRAWLLALLALPVLALMVATSSRGGLLAFVLGMLLFLVPLAPARRRIVALALGAFALIALGATVARDPIFAARLTRTFQQGNVAGRDEIYRAGWQLFLERPILGWGPVEFLYKLGGRLNLPQRDPHGMFFWIVLEAGLVGALFFFAGVWLCIRAAWKSRTGPEGILPLALMVTVIVVNLSTSWFAHKTFWVVLAIALASPVVRGEWQRGLNVAHRRVRGAR